MVVGGKAAYMGPGAGEKIDVMVGVLKAEEEIRFLGEWECE